MKTLTEKQPSDVLTPDTPNATYFDPNEVPDTHVEGNPRVVNYDRLRSFNRNTWKDRREENKQVTHRQDNLAILDCISTQLELNSFQKKKARRIFDSLDLQDIGKKAKLVAFGVCVVVANDDYSETNRYYPTRNDSPERFDNLAGKLGFTERQIQSVIGVVDYRRSE